MEDGTKDGTEPEPEKVSEEDEAGTEWPITRPEYAEIDALHLKDDHAAALPLILAADAQSAETQWRLARTYCGQGENAAADDAKLELFRQSQAAADKAVELDPENPYGHKWVAVSLGQASGLLGTKEKIQQSFRIKEEADKALEKLPDDASTHFLLGKWCLGVCNLGWVERKAASAFFATPPESSYEEALGYMLNAAKHRDDWVRAAQQVGDCYAKLNDMAKAKEWYEKTVGMECPEGSEEEKKAQEEAAAALKKL